MPITDLTARMPETPKLVRFGKIRKGAERPQSGNRPGKDLDHFRITLEPAYAHLAEVIGEELGPEPRDIPLVFVGETVDEVFPTWFEAWLASGLQHRCDGVTQAHGVTDTGKYADGIPCERGESDLSDPSSFACGCTRRGKLHVALPFLWGIQGEYGQFVLETGSIHDIIEVHHRLSTMHKLFGTLMMVPAILGRQERQISYSQGTKRRQNRTASLLTIRENLLAMKQTHPQIAAKMQVVIDAGTGAPALDAGAPALAAGEPAAPSDEYSEIVEWFDRELAGITSSTIRMALDGLSNPSRAQVISAVLAHWYEGEVDAMEASAKALCGDTPLANEVLGAIRVGVANDA